MAAMVDGDELVAIAKLLDELKHDDPQVRAASTMKLPMIAAALGAERTREELIPFLMESTDDEDEILLAMSEQLGNLIEHVGGDSFAYHLLAPLNRLAIVEDSAVRMKAIQSLLKVAKALPSEHMTEHWLTGLLELKAHDYVTARIAACSLCCVELGKFPAEARQQVYVAFGDLCGDHTPMVRRAAAENLGDFAICMVKGVSAADGVSISNEWTANQISRLIPLFTQLAMDEQDSVRFKTVDNCIKIASLFNIGSPPDGNIASTAAANPDPALANASPDTVLSYAEILGRVYSTALSCCADASWRMRWSLVAKLDEFLAVIGASPRLVIAFQGLLADPDTEVRTAACGVVGKVGMLVGSAALVNQVLPALGLVADDASDHVRVALAGSACALAAALGREETISRLLPLLLQLLRDTNSEVRLNIVAHLGEVNSVIGVELLAQSLLPTIFELARDGKWRVRQAIIDHMPMLATQLGVALFNERLVSQCLAWLHDDVFSVRTAAATNLLRLTELLGADWAVEAIIPQLTAMSNRHDQDEGNSNVDMTSSELVHPSAHRMASLLALASICSALGSSLVERHVIPVALKLSQDPIPNVRFNAAKTLELAIPLVETRRVVEEDAMPCLKNMLQDSDRDVQYYAGRAIAASS